MRLLLVVSVVFLYAAFPLPISAQDGGGCSSLQSRSVTCTGPDGCRETVTVTVCASGNAGQCVDLSYPTPCCSSQAWNASLAGSCDRGPGPILGLRRSRILHVQTCAGDYIAVVAPAAVGQ